MLKMLIFILVNFIFSSSQQTRSGTLSCPLVSPKGINKIQLERRL